MQIYQDFRKLIKPASIWIEQGVPTNNPLDFHTNPFHLSILFTATTLRKVKPYPQLFAQCFEHSHEFVT